METIKEKKIRIIKEIGYRFRHVIKKLSNT